MTINVVRAKGAVQRALESQLFGKFSTLDDVVVVAQTPGLIIKNNPERIGFVLVNTGNIKITFGLNQNVVDGKGFILPEAGDTMSSTFVEDGDFPTRELSAIASAAGGEIFIVEFIRIAL